MLQSRRHVALVAGVLGLSLLSCGREVTGPEDGVYPSGRMAALALDPRFPALPGANLASDIVPFVKVRVILRLTDGSVVKDTLVDFPSTADSISLTLMIPLPRSAPDSGATLGLSMAYLNTAGDTVFRGGPLPVTARPAGSPGASQPVSIPITWVPPGPVPASVAMSPDTGSAVAGSTTAFTAVASDAQGNIIPGTPVAFSSVDTSRAVTGAPGSGLVTWRAKRGPALIVATLLNGPADTSTFQVSLPASRLLLVSGDAQSATVNTALGEPITLRVTASDSVPVVGVPVTFTVTSGGGALSATADTSDANGLVSFVWTLGSVVGAQSVSAAAPGIATATRVVSATGLAPLPTQLAITSAPTAGVAGAPFASVTIEARDAAGVLTPLFTGPVTIALDTATAAGATLAGTTTVNAVAGIATFTDLSVTRAAAGLSLIATSGTLAPDTSAALSIAAAAAAQLASLSGSGQSGAVLTMLAAPFVVRVTDAFGNPVSGTTVTWAVTGGVGSLSTVSTVTDAAGEASTTLTLGGTLGSVTVAATAVGLSGSPQSFTATTTAGGPAQLFFSQSITSATAGSVNEWIVQVRDAAGNVATDFNGPVSVALIDGPPTAVLGGTTTVNAVNGFATFSTLTVNLAATTYRLVASSAGLPDAQSAVLTITPAAPAALVLVAGGAQTATVATLLADSLAFRLTDAFGNRIAGAAIDLTIEQGGGSLSPASGVTDAGGEFRSAWTLGAAIGAQLVRATVSTAPAVQVTASATAIAGVATQLVITSGAIGPQVAGVPLPDIILEARDAQGNLVTGFADLVSVRVESGPPGAPTDSLHVAAVGGIATFTAISLEVAGSYTLRFAAAGLADAISGSFPVNAAAAEFISPDSVSGDGQTGTVGQALALPLRAVVMDAFGNRIAGVRVVFTGTRGTDTLSVDSVSTTAAGVASLTPTLPTTTGPVAYIVTSDSLIGSGFPFIVTAEAGPLAQLTLITQPDTATAVTALPAFVVEARDAFGNHATSFAGAITAAIDTGTAGASLGGTTVVNATEGTASFTNLTLDLAGTYRLRFTAGVQVTTSNVVVLAGAPATIAITGGDGQTATAFAALTDSLTVRLTDAAGNPVALETVFWAVLTGDGTLSSSAVATNEGGFASVAWTLGGLVGTQTVSASASGLSAVTFAATATATNANVVWTGASSTLWSDAGNWSGGVAPTAGDSVRIAAGTPNSVVLDSAVFLTHLLVDAGAVVQLDTFPVFLSGSLDVATGASVLSDSIGSFVLVGAGTVRGTMPRLYVQSGPYELDGALNVTGDLGIINGQLEIGVFASSVGGSLTTVGAGTLAMTGGGALTVTGDAIFAGGSTAGLLTNGTLTVLGNFTQGGGSASAFSASPGHAVVLEGPARQEVTLLNPDMQLSTTCNASCFGSLRAFRGGGSGALAFLSDVKVLQALEVTGDSLDAFGFTLLAANAPTVAADVVIAGAVGFWSNPTRGASFQVDTLIAWSPASPTLLPADDTIPTIVVGQHAITAAHPGAVIVAGDAGTLNVEGSASVGSGTGVALRTLGNGRILMQDASDTLVVNGDAQFAGVTLPGLMVNGQLTIAGSLTQIGSGSTFLAEGSHVTRFTGAGATITFADPDANQLNAVTFAAAGALEFVTGARLAGNVVLDAGITAIGGPPATIRLGGDLIDAAGGRWGVPLTQFDGLDPQLPDSISGSVILTRSTTLDGRFAVAGDLTVTGGTFDIGGRSLVVGAHLAVSDSAIFRMASAADTVVVNGNASFAGASTAGQLSAGRLSLRGAFVQSGTAESFAATGAHETWFTGGDSFGQTINFSNPGSGTGTSHFANLGVALVLPGASVTLNTDAFADGRLLTAPSAARGFDALTPRLLTTLGADVTGLRMNGVQWALLEGSPVGSLDSLVFLGQDETVVQLAIARGSGTLALTNPQFQSVPTTGRYLRVTDSDGATGGVLTVNVSNPVPAAHGGFLETLGGAVVTGWEVSVGSQLALTTAAAGAAHGATFTTQPVVEIRDAQGSLVTTDNSTQVTLSVGAGATVLGTATVTAAGGVATFTDVGLSGVAATYTLTYTAAGLSDATQQVALEGGAATALVITSGPIGAQVAGVPLPTVLVEARDAVNNVATSFTGQVVARVERDGVPGDSVQVAAVAGVATFAGAIFETAGPANVRFSAAGLTDAVSDTFVVAAAAAAQINAQTATTVAGFAGLQIPNPLQVRVEDAFLNRVAGTSVDFVYVRGVDTLSLATVVSDSNGIASFQPVLALTPGESQVIARTTGLLNSPLVFTVNVFVGPAVELRMVAQPVATTAGATLAPVSVEATDQFGNRRGSFTLGVTVLVDSGPAGAVLSGTTTVNAVSGLATFSTLSVDLAGTYRFRFLADGLADTVSTDVTIAAGAASALVLTTDAAGAASGASFTTQPVVEIRDAFGNLVTTDNSTLVTLTADLGGTVVGTDTATAVGGVATFATAGLGGTVGNYTLTFSAGGLTAATQPIALSAGAAIALSVSTPAAGAVNGGAFTTQPVVAVIDAYSNVVTTDNTSVVTVSFTGDVVTGTITATAVAGIATFTDVGISGLAGTFDLIFSSPPLEFASQSIDLGAGEATALVLDGEIGGNFVAGQAISPFTVSAFDIHGNLATDFTAAITASIDSGTVGATLGGTLAPAAGGGTATFSDLTLDLAGTYRLRFSASGLSDAVSTNAPADLVVVTAAAATQLVVTSVVPDTIVAGTAVADFVVEARDPFGNLDLGYTNAVSSSWSNSVSAGDTGPTVVAVGGIATFSVSSFGNPYGTANTLRGDASFSFVDLAPAGPASTGAAFTVLPAAANALVVTEDGNLTGGVGLMTEAAGAASGAAFTTQPVVVVRDTYGNLVTTDNSTLVTLTVSGDGTVVGTDTVTASGGVATFTAAGLGGTAGAYTLTFSASGLTAATQGITLSAGTATALFYEIGTGNAAAGEALSSISIAARDSFGNIPPDFTATITATIDSGTVGATLSGTTAPSAVAGTVNFDDLSIDLVGTYRLRFSSPGLTDAVSGNFAITPAAPASVIIVSGDAQTGVESTVLADSITVRLRDAFTNPIPATNIDFFVLSGGGSTSPLVAATNAAGEASTAWTLGSLIGTQQMIVTVPGYEGVQVTVSATAQTASAPLIQWTGGGGNNNWENVANWNLSRVPVSTDSVVINVTDTVNVTTAATVGWLVAGESSSPLLTIGAGATLAVDSLAVFGSTSSVTMTGGTLTGGGSVSVLGTLTWSGGTMSGAGSTAVLAGGTASVAPSTGVTLNERSFVVGGDVDLGAGTIGAANLPTISVLSGGTLQFTASRSYVVSTGEVQIVNDGTLRKAASAGLVIVEWPIINTGTLEVTDDTLDVQGLLTHASGTLSILDGAALLARGETNATAAIAIGTGGRLQLQSGGIGANAGNHIFGPTSSITGTGWLRINSADTTRIQGGLDIDSLTVQNGNTWFESADTMIVNRGAYLGGGFFRGDGVIRYTGDFTLNAGNIVGTGTMHVAPTGSLALRGMTGWFVDVEGTARWGDYDMTFGQDTLNSVPYASMRVRPGAILDIQHDVTTPRELFARGATTGQVSVIQIESGATMRKSTGSGTSNIRSRILLSGVIDVLTGTINVQGSCAVTGGTKTGPGQLTGDFSPTSGCVIP